MRVCHLLSADLWAGAEVMACNLLRGLREYPDLDLHVLLLNEGRVAEELRSAGLSVTILDERRTSFPALCISARRHLGKISPHIIHSHRYKENILAYFARVPGRSPGLVSTQHGMPEPDNGAMRMRSRISAGWNGRILAGHFDRVVCVSFDTRDRILGNIDIPRDKVVVIHNGIELPEPCDPVRARGGTAAGSAGRFFPVKDYRLMVEIARVASERSLSLRFELAGDGPERGLLEERVARYSLENTFRFRGHEDDMNGFYRGIDFYLNTSLHEGIPMSILEAMAHRLPVVAPRIGGIAEIIEDGVEGFLVQGREPEAFAEKCLMLMDAGLRRRMGQAAREKVERSFSAGRMAGEYHRLYRELAG